MADPERPAVFDWDIFPFTGDIAVKPVREPQLPEPPRSGEDGGRACSSCPRSDDEFLWVDDDWRMTSPRPQAVPFVILETREHHDLGDLPPRLSAQIGPLMQRVERAFLGTGKFGRVYVNKWGDGAAHFHLWFYGRPLGALQLRGFFLPFWSMSLPPVPQDEWDHVMSAIAAGMHETPAEPDAGAISRR